MRNVWPLSSSPLLPDYPGSFGAVRSTDIHTGIDLYCPLGTEVRAVEDGTIVGVEAFTGAWAPGKDASPWWNNTMALLVRGESGVIVYGEVEPERFPKALLGRRLLRGEAFANIGQPVLKSNKGRPMVMLHLELLRSLPEGYTGLYLEEGQVSATSWWKLGDARPDRVLDPTTLLEGHAAPVFDLAKYNGRDFIDPAAPRKASEWWEVWGGTP